MAFETRNYGTVEAALIAAYRIPDSARSAFRGRLGSLQKGGLFAEMPGKGRALAYGPDEFRRLVLACELLEAGISPSTVLAIVKARWESRLRRIFKDAESNEDRAGASDVVLIIAGTMMTGEWSNQLPAVNAVRLHQLADQMALLMKSDDPRALPSRVIVTNLSQALRRFHAALAPAYKDELRDERAKAIKDKTKPAGKR